MRDPRCLKTKRMILRSLKARLRNTFNVSISELGYKDKWQKSALAIVGVGTDTRGVNSEFSAVLNFIQNYSQVSIVDYEMEMV